MQGYISVFVHKKFRLMTKRFLPRIKNDKRVFWLLCAFGFALMIPALFINLGLLPFYSDEPVRGLVSLEMILSKNYWIPHMGGELYYNKLPLYNWILAAVFLLAGDVSELTLRLPTIFFLFVFAFTMYYFARRFLLSKEKSILLTLVFITSGDVLFWDSLIGLIDMCFSWISFLNFMLIYHYFKKQEYSKLFFISYLLTIAGFMMKGLPALVYQFIALLAIFAINRKFYKLFLPSHFLAAGMFFIFHISYFFIYSLSHDPWPYIRQIWLESSSKSAIDHSMLKTFQRALLFPFEFIYKFFPWTIFIIFLFRKKTIGFIRANLFLNYISVVFIGVFLLYWFSPETKSRYLLMIMPLFFMVLLHFYSRAEREGHIYQRILSIFFMVFALLTTAGFLVLPHLQETKGIHNSLLKSIILFASALILVFILFKHKKQYLLVSILLLLLIRIGFNWFYLPYRHKLMNNEISKIMAIKAAAITKKEPVYVYKNTLFNEGPWLYMTIKKEAIIPRKFNTIDATGFYVTDPKYLKDADYEVYSTINSYTNGFQALKMVKFKLEKQYPKKN